MENIRAYRYHQLTDTISSLRNQIELREGILTPQSDLFINENEVLDGLVSRDCTFTIMENGMGALFCEEEYKHNITEELLLLDTSNRRGRRR